MDHRTDFAKNFRHARFVLNLKQIEIYKRSGVSVSHLSAIENGECNAGIDTMAKLANAVNIPLWQLFKPPRY